MRKSKMNNSVEGVNVECGNFRSWAYIIYGSELNDVTILWRNGSFRFRSSQLIIQIFSLQKVAILKCPVFTLNRFWVSHNLPFSQRLILRLSESLVATPPTIILQFPASQLHQQILLLKCLINKPILFNNHTFIMTTAFSVEYVPDIHYYTMSITKRM